MKEDDIRNAIAEENKAFLKKQEKKEAAIQKVYKDIPAHDQKGKLWGEKGVADLAGADGAKWSTDHEARIMPDYVRNPERQAIINELVQIASATIRENYGEEILEDFLDWLRGAAIEELARDRDVTFNTMLRDIKEAVRVCRERLGTNPKVYPFRGEDTLSREERERENYRRRLRRSLYGEAKPADESSRVYLTSEEQAMSPDVLRRHLISRGKKISRSGAYFAKKRGFYYKDYKASVVGTKRVYLTEEERNLPRHLLDRKFGISPSTARRAKKQGWFAVNVNNRDRVTEEARRRARESNLPEPDKAMHKE